MTLVMPMLSRLGLGVVEIGNMMGQDAYLVDPSPVRPLI